MRYLLAILIVMTPGPLAAGVNVTVVATPKTDQTTPNVPRQESHGIKVRVVEGLPTAQPTPADPPAAVAPQPVRPPDTLRPAAEPAFIPEVRFYSASWCPQCPRQQQILDSAGIVYRKLDGNTVTGGLPQVHVSTKAGGWKTFVGVHDAASIRRVIEQQTVVPTGELTAGQQPTPMQEVANGLRLLGLESSDELVDFGCGDARFLIRAARDYGVRGEGVEIDPAQADRAKAAVDAAGLTPLVTIIEGDATTTPVSANVGIAYLYPETLAKLRPQIEKLDRFASYQWAVPGLSMTKHGNWHLWTSKPQAASKPQTVTRQVKTFDHLARGSYCQQCGGYCSNPMSHWYTKTIEVPVNQSQSAPTVQRGAPVSSSMSRGPSTFGSKFRVRRGRR